MKPNPKQACLDDLRNRILTLAVEPGSDLDEAELCARYGISRTPLREVLQRLSGEGYVAMTANRGAKVTSMNLGAMRTFFRTAPLIYCSIMRLAAENRTGQQLAALKKVQSAFRAAVAEARAPDMALQNHRFHELIGEMAADPYLKASLDRLLIDHTRMSQTFYRPQSAPEADAVGKAVQQHDAMIAALEAHEAEVAVELTLRHWDLSRDRIERFVRPDPLPLDVVDLSEKRHAV
ncbi:MAG: GntR family transcriptional regulator [Alphaproteobacteria bacterium]|nr:GntR family transcriptional regulator [Alphaproteobacteria bacterium]